MKNTSKMLSLVAGLAFLLVNGRSFAVEGYDVTMSFLENPFAEHGGEPGDGEASICCTSTTRRNCQTAQQDTSVPARRIAVLAPGTGTMSVDIFDGPDCINYVQTVTASYNFPEVNLWEVDLDFVPRLEIGRQISLKWTEGTCEQLACANYTVGGSEPPGCWDDY